MNKSVKFLFVAIAVASVAYTISPLFSDSKKQSFRSEESADAKTVRDSAAEAIRGAVYEAKSALGMNTKCSAPFRYAIGNVDPRFGIGRDEVKAGLAKAEEVWEETAHEDLLQYDEQSDFKVNLVFDDRQRQTLESKKLEQKLETVQTMQNGISSEYDALTSRHDKKNAQYESDVNRYEGDVREYEKQVAYWNGKGGAPEDEYRKLQQDKKDLDAAANTLEKQRKDLNALVEQINALVKKEKKVVSGYNSDVATYESRYGSDKAFDQGVYTGKDINIYQFSETGDLVLVLAHELGHALSMDHVENPKSIMYSLMGKQDIDHPTPSAEDMAALKNRCSGV